MFEKGTSEEEPVQLGRRRAEGGPMQGWRKQQGYLSNKALVCQGPWKVISTSTLTP